MIWLFLIPFLGALVTAFIKNKPLAVLISLSPLAFLLFGNLTPETYSWFPPLSIVFDLKIDGMSRIFLYLTAIIIPIALIVSKPSFYSLILFLEGLLIGFFTARDLVFFTIFWEAMLLPLYFLINLGNQPERQSAAMKFLLYMFAGSVLMVAAIIALYLAHGTFDMEKLSSLAAATPNAYLIFGIFALAFAVKTPLFPFHAWLPDAYEEAPTAGTILLSALLSKAGIYGFLRIGLQLFPSIMADLSLPLISLAIIGVLYGALAAYQQNNFKRLIAYSSFSHVNFILAGIFTGNEIAIQGAILQAFNHGIIITGLFLVSGWLEHRLNSTSLFSASGLANFFPRLATLTFIFILASIALPGTNSFIGEVLILYGLFANSPWLAAILGSSIILSAAYMLRWMQNTYFQAPTPPPLNTSDIGIKNILIALPLVLIIFWIGLYPHLLLKEIS